MLFTLSFLGLLAPAHPAAPVAWSFEAHAQKDGVVLVELLAKVEDGWHLYATTLPSAGGPLPTIFRFTPSNSYAIVGELQEPAPVEEYDANFGMLVRHHSGEPRFVLAIEPSGGTPFVVEGELEYMVCNEKTCLPPVTVPFRIAVPTT
ncbi:MAG: hypothetical protein KA941_02140 [Flavobacteriales bacterium]|nr:hypothetical protein [Flavobacteriales bacterium]